jgi:MYXO-CTERM domain-containing protein
VGGAIAVVNGPLTIVNSTLSGNDVTSGSPSAPTEGSAIAVAFANATIESTTIAENRGGVALSVSPNSTVHIGNTILADTNSTADCDAAVTTLISDGHNLVEKPGNCLFIGDRDQTNIDPGLSPLADNGGPTHTQAITTSSPAFATGSCNQSVDQRGVPRLQLPICDIGAYEVRRFLVSIAISGLGKVTNVQTGFVCNGATCVMNPVLPNTFLSFTAKPAVGWVFIGWQNACMGTGSCAVTVTSDVTVVARFQMVMPTPDAQPAPDAGPSDAPEADAGAADAGSPDAVVVDAPVAELDAVPTPPDAVEVPDAAPPDAVIAMVDSPPPPPDAMEAVDAAEKPDAVVAPDGKIIADAFFMGVPDAPPPLPLDRGCSCHVGQGPGDGDAPSALMLIGLTIVVMRTTRRRR